jgi:hypothetical protein
MIEEELDNLVNKLKNADLNVGEYLQRNGASSFESRLWRNKIVFLKSQFNSYNFQEIFESRMLDENSNRINILLEKKKDEYFLKVTNNGENGNLNSHNISEKVHEDNYYAFLEEHLKQICKKNPQIYKALLTTDYKLKDINAIENIDSLTSLYFKILDSKKYFKNKTLSDIYQSLSNDDVKKKVLIKFKGKKEFNLMSMLKGSTVESVNDFLANIEEHFLTERLIKDVMSNKHKNLINKKTKEYFREVVRLKIPQQEFRRSFISKISKYKTAKDLEQGFGHYLGITSGWDKNYYVKQLNEKNINFKEVKENVLMVNIFNYQDSKAIGSSQWCISTSETMFKSYTSDKKRQYFIFDFNKKVEDKMSMVGVTVDKDGNITDAHDKNDSSIKSLIKIAPNLGYIKSNIHPLKGDKDYIEMIKGKYKNSPHGNEMVFRTLSDLCMTGREFKEIRLNLKNKISDKYPLTKMIKQMSGSDNRRDVLDFVLDVIKDNNDPSQNCYTIDSKFIVDHILRSVDNKMIKSYINGVFSYNKEIDFSVIESLFGDSYQYNNNYNSRFDDSKINPVIKYCVSKYKDEFWDNITTNGTRNNLLSSSKRIGILKNTNIPFSILLDKVLMLTNNDKASILIKSLPRNKHEKFVDYCIDREYHSMKDVNLMFTLAENIKDKNKIDIMFARVNDLLNKQNGSKPENDIRIKVIKKLQESGNNILNNKILSEIPNWLGAPNILSNAMKNNYVKNYLLSNETVSGIQYVDDILRKQSPHCDFKNIKYALKGFSDKYEQNKQHKHNRKFTASYIKHLNFGLENGELKHIKSIKSEIPDHIWKCVDFNIPKNLSLSKRIKNLF